MWSPHKTFFLIRNEGLKIPAPAGNQKPGRPARRQWLYWLSYLGWQSLRAQRRITWILGSCVRFLSNYRESMKWNDVAGTQQCLSRELSQHWFRNMRSTGTRYKFCPAHVKLTAFPWFSSVPHVEYKDSIHTHVWNHFFSQSSQSTLILTLLDST
jgi:hypothetical protein